MIMIVSRGFVDLHNEGFLFIILVLIYMDTTKTNCFLNGELLARFK